MKLHLDRSSGLNLFSGHGEGYVTINGRNVTSSVLMLPDKLVEPWPLATYALLTAESLLTVIQYAPEVVLLGTGGVQRFPDSAILKAVRAGGLPLEVMATPALCRTYNILAGEGRRVAALVFLA